MVTYSEFDGFPATFVPDAGTDSHQQQILRGHAAYLRTVCCWVGRKVTRTQALSGLPLMKSRHRVVASEQPVALEDKCRMRL